MRGKIVNLVDKFGLLVAGLLAVVAGIVALFSLEVGLLLLGLAVCALAFSLFVSIRVSRRMSRRGVAAPVTKLSPAQRQEPNMELLREFHLDTLEEIRMLKAQIASMISRSK